MRRYIIIKIRVRAKLFFYFSPKFWPNNTLGGTPIIRHTVLSRDILKKIRICQKDIPACGRQASLSQEQKQTITARIKEKGERVVDLPAGRQV